MVLGVDAPQFPFSDYVERKTKQSGKYMAGQDLGDLADMLPQLMQFYQKQKAVQGLQQALQGQGQPQQGPPLPGAGAPGMPPPSSGMGGPPQDNMNSIISNLMQIDPSAATRMMTDQGSQTPAFSGPNGQFSASPQKGFSPFGKVDRGDLMKTMAGQQEKGASLQERAKDAEANRQIRLQAQQIQQLLAQGKHDEALARLEEVKSGIKERSLAAKRTARINAQKENAKHWFSNPVTVPKDPDAEGGWTAEDEKRLQELSGKAQ